MGLFSWDCKGCGRSIRGPYCGSPGWMGEAVARYSTGLEIEGTYTGYAGLEKFGTRTESVIDLNPWYSTVAPKTDDVRLKPNYLTCPVEEPELWHQACFAVAGRPAYEGPSVIAGDQGHFVGGSRDPQDPRTLKRPPAWAAKYRKERRAAAA